MIDQEHRGGVSVDEGEVGDEMPVRDVGLRGAEDLRTARDPFEGVLPVDLLLGVERPDRERRVVRRVPPDADAHSELP